jgi:two-component system, NtrC family, nitrogen regulation response regulator GlnG
MSARIWIVDDDHAVRFVLATALREAGHAVDGFGNAADALDALRTGGAPDLLFTDVRMPGDDGLMLLEKLKTAQPQLPVVVMSAYTDVASTAGAFRGGAHEFLSKPFDLDDAVALAERTLGRAADAGPAGETPHAAAAADADALQLVGESPAMRQVFRAVGRLALAPLSVLVTGETGTGKELVARALHRESPRARGRSSRSTPRRSPRSCSSPNCSGTRPAHSPAPSAATSAASSRRTAAPCSWTRSATCRCRCRPGCCGCWPRASSSGSAAAS